MRWFSLIRLPLVLYSSVFTLLLYQLQRNTFENSENKISDSDVPECTHDFDRLELPVLANGSTVTTACGPIGFSNNILPLTALASSPGSGNTWMRHLIQMLTGIYTGSNEFLDDSVLKFHGFPGEGVKNGSVIAIKTHGDWYSSIWHKAIYDRAIVIVRNPFQSIAADFNRAQSGHTGEAIDFKGWHDHVYRQLSNWEKFHRSWLQSDLCVLLVSYHDLKANILHELLRIAEFLNIPPSNLHDEHLQCVMSYSEGNFKRKHHPKSYPFNELMKERIAKSMKRVQAAAWRYHKMKLDLTK